jgi:hypothetical protein
VILVRAWIRQALGASGAALVVPAVILGMLVLLTLSGGLGRIGNIGQAFSGPRLPARAAPTPSRASKAHARPQPLLAAQGRGPGRTVASPAAPTHAPGTASGRPAPSGGQGGFGGPGRGSGGSGATAGGAPAAGGSGGPSPGPGGPSPGPGAPSPGPGGPSPSHRPSPGPTLVSRVTGAAASAARRLPGPLGPAAAQTVETVGSAAGSLVPAGPAQSPIQASTQLPALASIR